MSRVNLLPREYEERGRQRRRVIGGTLAVLIFIALLGLVFVNTQASVDDAVAERDEAQARVNQLQAEVNALAAFQALATELSTGNTLVTTALSDEIAVARVLNDVALTMPSTASLTALTLDRNIQEASAGEVELGEDVVANLLLSGYSTERYAPGVEGVLLRLDQVDGLVITYLNAASLADISEIGVTSFDANGLLDPEILTQRYAEGLPEAEG